jgi:hypothetical protein
VGDASASAAGLGLVGRAAAGEAHGDERRSILFRAGVILRARGWSIESGND